MNQESSARERGFTPLPAGEPHPGERRLRICVLTSEQGGQAGTAAVSLAVALATQHEVTLLWVGGQPGGAEPDDAWITALGQQGVRVTTLPQADVPLVGPWHIVRSYEVYLWLQTQAFDVVHVAEWQGHGYYALLARRQRLALGDTLFVVSAHGPTLWQKQCSGEYVDALDDLELDFLERQSVALADVVVSPSRALLDWMQGRGWQLPARCHVQANLAPPGTPPAPAPGGRRPVTELVYHGPLERRAGLLLFCDALDRLARSKASDLSITFLGPDGQVGGGSALDYLQTRARKWPFRWQVLGDLHPAEALAYLQGAGRAAVLPALVASSSYAVLACLHAGIPFLATAVGGVPDLVAAPDREAVLVPPRADALARQMRDVTRAGLAPARPAVDPEANRQAWRTWHASLPPARSPAPQAERTPLVSVIISHFNRPALLRQALTSLEQQSYAPLEVIVVDDGSTQPEALQLLDELEQAFPARGWRLLRQEERFPGAARNAGARLARGDYLLFMDDDNVAKPHEVATYVRVALATGADVLTSLLDVFTGAAAPAATQRPLKRYLPLGAAVAAGALNNYYGDTNALIRRDVFFALGGFTEEFGLGHEDWEFFARAALRGYRLDVVPEALFWYRVTEGGMTENTHTRPTYSANFLRSIRPYLDAVPPPLRDLVLYCQGTRFRLDKLSEDYGEMYRYLQGVERWSDHLKGEHSRLAEQHEHTRHWCLHLEEQYRQLQGRHEELQALLAQRRYRMADRAHALLHKVPLVLPLVRGLLNAAQKLRRAS